MLVVLLINAVWSPSSSQFYDDYPQASKLSIMGITWGYVCFSGPAFAFVCWFISSIVSAFRLLRNDKMGSLWKPFWSGWYFEKQYVYGFCTAAEIQLAMFFTDWEEKIKIIALTALPRLGDDRQSMPDHLLFAIAVFLPRGHDTDFIAESVPMPWNVICSNVHMLLVVWGLVIQPLYWLSECQPFGIMVLIRIRHSLVFGCYFSKCSAGPQVDFVEEVGSNFCFTH